MKIFDWFESFFDDWAPFFLVLALVFLVGSLAYFCTSLNSPATDKELLAAKSECPTISNYLPDSIVTSSSLEFYLQKCHDDQVISKQKAILK